MRIRSLSIFGLSAAGLLLAAAAATAAPGAAGYDPDSDPAADLERAKTAAAQDGKRILLEVGGEWCGWCHRLERFVHERESVRDALAANFVVVKVNVSDENENQAFLADYPPIRGYPHLFVLDADGRLLHSQDTGALEDGERSYDESRFLAFLERWSPGR